MAPRLALEEGGPTARSRAGHRFGRGVIDRHSVVAVHDHAWNAIPGRPDGDILDVHVLVRVSGDGKGVVLADVDDREVPDGGQVERLVELPSVDGPVAEKQARLVLPV